MTFVTDAIRALIDVPGPRFQALSPLGLDELRRFVHAVLETDPVHWDADAAGASRYGSIVAPPLYVIHSTRRAAGTPDPLDRLAEEPGWDALDVGAGFGGTEAEFFRLPTLGTVISAQSRYIDIADREGRSGPMVIARIETSYSDQDGEQLARVVNTVIMR